MNRGAILRFILLYNVPAADLARAVSGVSDALAAGALSELPLHRFDLEEAALAHQAVEEAVVGKVVIEIPD